MVPSTNKHALVVQAVVLLLVNAVVVDSALPGWRWDTAAETSHVRPFAAASPLSSDSAASLVRRWALSEDAEAVARSALVEDHVQRRRAEPLSQAEDSSLDKSAMDFVGRLRLQHIHDPGFGPVIVKFIEHDANGVELLGGRVSVILDRLNPASKREAEGAFRVRALAGRGQLRNNDGAPAHGGFEGTTKRSATLSHALATATAVAAFLPETTPSTAVTTGQVTDLGYGGWFTVELVGSEALAFVESPVRIKAVVLPGKGADLGFYAEVWTRKPAGLFGVAVRSSSNTVVATKSLSSGASYGYYAWTDSNDIPADLISGAPRYVLSQECARSANPSCDPWIPGTGSDTMAGNNVHAYTDMFGSDGFNASDGDTFSSAVSGNFSDALGFDATTSAPNGNVGVANLFYGLNWLHDWFYVAGFDEAAGNAQVNNYGRGGVGNDPINAEVNDFSGTNNANMATPADGVRPRMQMYLWDNFDGQVTSAPPFYTGTTAVFGSAEFSPASFDITASAVLVQDAVSATNGCNDIANDVVGKIAIVDRGVCSFAEKALKAEAAGAIGMIVVNTADTVFGMSGTGVTFASVMISFSDGAALKALLSAGVQVTMQSSNVQRMSALDSSVLVHEWGHYINHRLANGLGSQESNGLGEGNADFTWLLVNVRNEADVAKMSMSNPVGTYSTGQSGGIRRYPYSTNTSISPLTLRHIVTGEPLPTNPPPNFDSGNNANVHSAGEIWAQALFDVYAALIDRHPGNFGEAQRRMKIYFVAHFGLLPSDPSFVESKDALLASVSDSDDFEVMCEAFSRRGFGPLAVPSTDRYSTTNNGTVEDFSVSAAVRVEAVSVALRTSDDCDRDQVIDAFEPFELVINFVNRGCFSSQPSQIRVNSSLPGTFAAFNINVPSIPGGGRTQAQVTIPGGYLPHFEVVSVFIGTEVFDLFVGNYDILRNASATQGNVTAKSAERGGWTVVSGSPKAPIAWAVNDRSHSFLISNLEDDLDESLVSPLLVLPSASAPVTVSFVHAFYFEEGFDGGVVDFSDNGGSWQRVNLPYPRAIDNLTSSALAGEMAFTGSSSAYLAHSFTLTGLAGPTFRIRFRAVTDEFVIWSAVAWEVSDIAVSGIANMPFAAIVPQQACTLPPSSSTASVAPGGATVVSVAASASHGGLVLLSLLIVTTLLF